MITVAMGAGEELNLDPREWFDKATSAQVDHIGAYSRYRNTLLPRWGGSYKAMHDFAMECAGTDRYDTLVPYEYLETVYSVIRDSGRDDLWAHEPTFQQAKTILTRYAERHPSQMSPYLSHVAGIAWEGGHYAEAKSILDRLGDKLDMSFIEYFAPLPKLAIDQVHAMTSPLKAKITAAEAFLENEDVAGAVKAYDAMLTNAADEPGARYVLARRNELDLWHRAEKEWVSLKPDKHLTGWHPTGGEWSVDDDGRLVCTMGKAQETIIVYPADPGRAYEMRCRVEYELSPGTKPSAGPVVAYAGRNRRYGMYVSLRGELLVKSGATYLEPFKSGCGKRTTSTSSSGKIRSRRSSTAVSPSRITASAMTFPRKGPISALALTGPRRAPSCTSATSRSAASTKRPVSNGDDAKRATVRSVSDLGDRLSFRLARAARAAIIARSNPTVFEGSLATENLTCTSAELPRSHCASS
jgi:hypothetical protein